MRTVGKLIALCLVLSLAFLSTGCVTNMYPGGPTPAGGIVTVVTSPAQKLTVATDPEAQSIKAGEASNMAFLGLFAFGDGSTDAAMLDGGLTKVHHVDHEVISILWGLWLQNKIIVHGE